MKKFLIILLLCFVAQEAFAQRFRWGLATDFSSDIFRVVNPIGDAAAPYFWLDGVRVPNIGTNLLPVNNFLAEPPNVGGAFVMGRGAFTSGHIAFGANNSDRSWTRHNAIRITMNGTGESVAWRMRINMENLVQPHHSQSQMVTGSGRPNGLQDLILLRQLDEWWIRGRAGTFTAWLGNAEAGSGVTSPGRFTDFSDWSRGVKIDNFGIMIPASVENPATLNDGSENNSFLRMWRLTSHPGNTGNHDRDTPVVLIMSARINNLTPFPLNVDLGFDPGRNSGHGGNAGINPRNAFTANGAVRISGLRAADNLFNFDVIYQFRGFDPNTLENLVMGEDGNPLPGFDQNQPDGRREFIHTMGAYFHFPSPLPALGVSFGYSLIFRSFEDNASQWVDNAWRTTSTITPFFHGVDLRLRYTGIQNWRFTLHNNVSFAIANAGTWTGDELDGHVSINGMGLAGVNPMSTTYHLRESQSWLGFYNAFSVRHFITPRFNLTFEAANRLGITTQSFDFRTQDPLDVVSIRRTRHDFICSFYANHVFSARITLEVGLSFRMLNHTWERNFRGDAPNVTALNDTSPGANDGRHGWDSGFWGISMPIRMRISF